jgi:thiamine-phosphate pyrophosphorylase
MLILISNPTPLVEEATLINQFFDEGLDVFHIRKPQDSARNVIKLIEAIDSRYHMQISLHQDHHLAGNYGIKRLHFSERVRYGQKNDITKALKNEGFILSTSVHSVEDFEHLNNTFMYSFIGPVFDSISKPGYLSKVKSYIPAFQKCTKAIAIGGIKASNIYHLKGRFDGIGILGAIWQSNAPLTSFLQIRKIWNTQDP